MDVNTIAGFFRGLAELEHDDSPRSLTCSGCLGNKWIQVPGFVSDWCPAARDQSFRSHVIDRDEFPIFAPLFEPARRGAISARTPTIRLCIPGIAAYFSSCASRGSIPASSLRESVSVLLFCG